jgi:hypothetical protein
MSSYEAVEIKLTPDQVRKLVAGAMVRLSPAAVEGREHTLLAHPLNAKMIKRAKSNKRGVSLKLSPGELMATKHSDLNGTGWLDSVWNGIKSVGSWLKDSGVGTALADAGQQALTPLIGETGANVARKLVKGVAGVGITPIKGAKGSQEMRDRMAKLRSMRGKKKSPTVGQGLYL